MKHLLLTTIAAVVLVRLLCIVRLVEVKRKLPNYLVDAEKVVFSWVNGIERQSPNC